MEKSYQNAKGEKSEKDVTYAYNSAGERVSMKDQTGKSSYEYDALGRITKVTSGSEKDVSISDHAEAFLSVFIVCEFYDIYLCDSGKEREVNRERRDQTETDRCSHRTCKNL